MVPVHDQAGHQSVVRKLFPDHVVVPVKELRTAVAEVGCESGPRVHSVPELFAGRRGVADGDPDTLPYQVFGQLERARRFGRERDEQDPPARRILAALEVINVCRHHLVQRVRAAGTVERRDIRSLHVQACDGRVVARENGAHAVGETFE